MLALQISYSEYQFFVSRRRFIADEVSGSRAALLGEHAAHLVRVLRASLGQQFDIATEGRVRSGRIIKLADDRVDFELGEEIPVATTAAVTLWLAVFKFERMEWAIEKATELGVAHIVPVLAARTDAHLAAAALKRCERWRRIALQAAEQSRRAAPPEISDPLRLQRQSLLSQPEFTCVVLAESEQRLMLKDALQHFQDGRSAPGIHLAVGPEGGWTVAELALFAEAGWVSASLGQNILRAETAAIAALAIVSAYWL